MYLLINECRMYDLSKAVCLRVHLLGKLEVEWENHLTQDRSSFQVIYKFDDYELAPKIYKDIINSLENGTKVYHLNKEKIEEITKKKQRYDSQLDYFQKTTRSWNNER